MKKSILLYVVVLSVTTLMSCQSSPKKTTAQTPAAPEALLLQAEAETRAQQVTNVSYELVLGLQERSELFHGRVGIAFDMVAPVNLFLDFQDGAKILNFAVNGKTLTPVFANHRIQLPASELHSGGNAVVIEYEQRYAHNGRGLHRFVDPEDQRVYLYTQFENFDAHQMFPCFDQPDIKATFRLNVSAPKTWEVISTMRETEKKGGGETTVWAFPETPKISTYLFSLHAGEYKKWEAKADTVPMRLFARQTLAKYVDPAIWFKFTKAGLSFYGQYYDYPYPFKKYDQIIVPEFNAGAMENVAAITFSERFIHRGPSTRQERESLAGVILHEMAHQWFGDLVTMKWWNAAWLNESFATFMSHVAGTGATEFKDSQWTEFQAEKSGAYLQDQQVTTHPIEADVPDTSSAFSNFDAITYGKGASVLKELNFLLGENVFREGVRLYFKKHAYGNTRLKDFIGALEAVSHRDLKGWSRAWLETAGVDSLQTKFSCDNGTIKDFSLERKTAMESPAVRLHATQVTLFERQGEELKPYSSERVEYEASQTPVAKFIGKKCPAFVYPNDMDHDYVKVLLDQQSLGEIDQHLIVLKTPLLRLMVWNDLFSMVRDVTLSPQRFLHLAERSLPNEDNMEVGRFVMESLPTMVYYLPRSNAKDETARTESVQSLERLLWRKAIGAKPGADWQRLALTGFTDIVETPEGRDRLVGVLDGSLKIPGFVLDTDFRWNMVIHLSSLGDRRAEGLLATLRNSDHSDRGVANAFAAEAAFPIWEKKQAWIDKVVDKGELSFSQKRRILQTILPRTQDDLRASLANIYFTTLPHLAQSQQLEVSSLYGRTLIPATCTEPSVSSLKSFIKSQSDHLPQPIVKTLRIGHQEDDRCVRIRAYAATAQGFVGHGSADRQ